MYEFKLTTLVLVVAPFAFAASACGSATDASDSVSQTSEELKGGAPKTPPEDTTTPVSKAVKVAHRADPRLS